MPPKKAPAKAKQLNASTNAFLQSLNAGPLTFAQLLSSIRESDQQVDDIGIHAKVEVNVA